MDPLALIGECAGLPDFVPARPPIAKLSYSHEAMINMLVSEMPPPSQGELARRFGYSQSWISTVMRTDAFKVKLEERRLAIQDPVLRERVKEQLDAVMDEKARIAGLMARSLEVLEEKMSAHHTAIPDQLALRTLELTSRAAGYGARVEINNNVNVTQQIDDAGDQLVTLLRRKKAEILEGELADE